MPNVVVATWPFSHVGVDLAAHKLTHGGSLLDAVEVGIEAVEYDSTVTSVGYGGLPNAAGELELDAALMCGTSSSVELGAVMGLKGFLTAIDGARLVLDHSPHSMLCGAGAKAFVIRHGIVEITPSETLLTPHARKRYAEYVQKKDEEEEKDTEGEMTHTDTVGMLAADGLGNTVAGCATSGFPFKEPGRVGDSPIFGAGLYAEKDVGAATATGDGDQMVRFCLSFLTVERMRAGMNPTDAAREAVGRVLTMADGAHAAIIAVDGTGKVGAAATHDGFVAVVWSESEGTYEIRPKGEGREKWEHKCV